jgi:ABC-type polysaccharide/polyol phosphate export permease
MIYESIQPTAIIFLLPLSMLSALILAQGLGMMLAPLQVRIRDVKQVVDLTLRAAFFLSGVFFGAEHIPPEHLETFLMNPVAVYIEMARAAILGDMSMLTWTQIVRSIGLALIFFFIGSAVFVTNERKAVKFL